MAIPGAAPFSDQMAALQKLLHPVKPKEPSAVEQAMNAARPQPRPRPHRTARINMRLRPSDKQSIEATAEALGMSPGDYLVQLHQAALHHFKKPD